MMGRCAVGGLPADHPADLEAVHAGQVEVEEDEVGARAHGVQALLARARHAHLQPDLLELVPDRLRDVGLVFDQDDAPPSRARRRPRRFLGPHGVVGSSW